jgi:hypothetical protein
MRGTNHCGPVGFGFAFAVCLLGCNKFQSASDLPDRNSTNAQIEKILVEDRKEILATASLIRAGVLTAEWDKNKKTCLQKYSGWIVVRGIVLDTFQKKPKDKQPVAVVKLINNVKKDSDIIECELEKIDYAAIADLFVRGQEMTVRGWLAKDTYRCTLLSCQLLDVGPDPTITITAEQLALEYSTDEKAADRKYLNKTLVVSGSVIELRDGKTNYVTLAGHNEKAEVPFRVELGNISEQAFSELRQGAVVNFKGVCKGAFKTLVLIESAKVIP